MITISIVASGTRGDVQPYVALGHGLKAAGYPVRLLASENFAMLAREADLDFVSTGESVEAVLQSDEWRKTTENGNFLTILAKMRSEMKGRAAEIAQLMPTLLQGSDLILTGMSGMGGIFSIAELLKIPVVQAYVVPFAPTKEYPAPLVPKLPFGQTLNRLSYSVVQQMMWQMSKSGDAATRQFLGMAKGSFWGPFAALKHRQVPALFGYSRHILPSPHDWPENYQVTGYWFLDAPNEWTPPSDLTAFLNAGKPPVYIGFGSMINGNPEAAGAMVLEALKQSGQRGVLASGWGGLKPSDLPDTVHLIDSIPHSWLFPQMAAVVHHGGAGTTAAGLRAGVPSILIPFTSDQPFWGQRIADLGVGPKPIPRKKLTSQGLAEAITEAVSNTAMRQQANELGQKIQVEDGIANAVEFIRRFTQQSTINHRSSAAVKS
ncbi:MAG: glycosyltransferase [Chloroflexota bacterium]